MPEWLGAGFAQFHFLRPAWLLLLPVALLTAAYLWRQPFADNGWRSLIDANLLPLLLHGESGRPSRLPFVTLCIALVIASLAMAGPAWEKLPQPVHRDESALVVMFDLSPSMLAEDLAPSRLVRARLKLIDLLKQRREGLTALVVYAGEAHTVTPLTDDTDTIISLLPSLSPHIMPVTGSNTEMALVEALSLMKEAGVTRGELLLVSDGVADSAANYLANNLPTDFRLSVLGVGTPQGAPIPLRSGGFAKDNNGAIVLARLEEDRLAALAQRCGGIYQRLTPTDADLKALQQQAPVLSDQTRQIEREFDTWQDRGAWLCWLLLPAALLTFRKGWLVAALPLMLLPDSSWALQWQDLWLTPDQQGQRLLQQEQPDNAAELFQRPDWKAAAAYRAGDYERAAKLLEEQEGTDAAYNRGNALAKAGQLREALAAYDQALELSPDMEDARINRDLVQSLLEQQQQQQQQQQPPQDQQQGEDNQQQGSNQSGSGEQSGDDQGGEQANSDQGSEQSQSGTEAQNSDGNKAQNEAEDSGAQANQEQNKQRQENSDEASQQQAADPQEQTPESHGNPEIAQQSSEAENPQQTDSAVAQESRAGEEEQQAMEQWLRKIPDDPGGLMRRKFEYESRQRVQKYRQGNWRPPENGANARW